MLQCSIAMLGMALGACAGSGARQCVDNSECASGLCLADGTCAAAPDGGTGGDGAPGDDGGPGGDGGIASCRPNHDGTISRDEVSFAAGRVATFRVATDVTVDTAGTLQQGGAHLWDLVGPYDGDDDVVTTLAPLSGAWFAADFDGATYTTPLSATQDLIGVFEITDTALLLRGVVSPNAGPTRTELTYDPPAVLLQLPLTTTTQWSSTSTISGVASGVASYYSEKYESRVDATGDLDTPYGTFPVLRVRTLLTRTVGAAVVTVRSLQFVAECYGTVATVTSNQYESDVDFTTAAELRRLAP